MGFEATSFWMATAREKQDDFRGGNRGARLDGRGLDVGLPPDRWDDRCPLRNLIMGVASIRYLDALPFAVIRMTSMPLPVNCKSNTPSSKGPGGQKKAIPGRRTS
jgi:hypothetical protein